MAFSKGKLLACRPFIRFLYRFARTYCWTFRLRIENETQWRDHLDAGGRVLLCCWHQQFFSFIRHFQSYRSLRPSLMISKSADGEMVAGVAVMSGWHTVRGSSSRGGSQALARMVARLRESGLAGHILDGPRGPIGRVKKGAIYLAQDAGARIVPTYAIAENAWFFNSWDRFFLPKPFSRVTIRFGEMLTVPKTSNPQQFEAQRKNLEETMRSHLVL
jgi:lysophospholipid acyltransferase (LPLAT)-like uncharacterized protein